MGELWDKLTELSNSDMYPFHMPGHKRNTNTGMSTDLFFDRDITEIDDFDNLHDASSLLYTCQKRANDLYKAGETFFLVNGSTCGVLSAVSAAAGDGDTILTARNCHKSLFHAAYLRNLNLKYLYPENTAGFGFCGPVSPDDVADALMNNTEVKAVFITSPTYEGVYSDIRKIADIAHSHGLPLIVDEAHGAHLDIAEGMPEGAIAQGADIVIHSLHKTLPSVTQTALLHVNGDLVDRDRLKRFLRIYQSSSPSYLMMASIDDCISYMTQHGDEYAKALLSYHDQILDAAGRLKHLEVPGYSVVNDPCKIVISCRDTSITGTQLYDILRSRYGLQPEMACESYVLMIITGMDTQKGIERLIEALEDIDGAIESKIDEFDSETDHELNPDCISEGYLENDHEVNSKDNSEANNESDIRHERLTRSISLRDAWDREHEYIPLDSAPGRVAGDFVNLYPPGIPLVVPGEEISADLIKAIREDLDKGLNVQGIEQKSLIRVVV